MYRGDTITDACKEEDLKMKLDFRVGFFSPSFTYDTATGEFAKTPTPLKYYSDRLKSFIATKVVINSIIKKCTTIKFEGMTKLQFPIVQVMGFEAIIYVLRLSSPGLYTVQKAHKMNFPTSLKDLRMGGMSNLYQGLLLIEVS